MKDELLVFTNNGKTIILQADEYQFLRSMSRYRDGHEGVPVEKKRESIGYYLKALGLVDSAEAFAQQFGGYVQHFMLTPQGEAFLRAEDYCLPKRNPTPRRETDVVTVIENAVPSLAPRLVNLCDGDPLDAVWGYLRPSDIVPIQSRWKDGCER